MWEWLCRKFLPRFKNDVEKNDFSMFIVTVCLTIMWWWMMINEAFHFNRGNIVTPYIATEVWQIWMGLYVLHKGYARWHNIELNSGLWGRSFGAVTIVGGFALFLLRQYFPCISIPEQLVPGMEGTAINIFGWSAFKAYHLKEKCQPNGKNGSSVSGSTPANSNGK